MSKIRVRPKVIHAIETEEPGGAESILVLLADSLRRDYEPVGLVMKEGWTSAELTRRGIPVKYIPLDKSFDFLWVAKAVGFIINNNVKLIHSHEFSCNSYLTIAAKITRIPIICTAHGKNYYPEKYYRRFAYRRVATMADSFVVVSKDLKDFIVTSVGIQPKYLHVVHNGINIDQFRGGQYDSKIIRAELSLALDDFVIIVVAALFETKGHKDLLQAISSLGEQADRIKLLFVGDGDYKSSLVILSKQLNIEDKIEFLGFRNDVARMLAVSDLFILPSYSEGMPVSVLEAMSAKVLVIATNVGGLGELIIDGVNGYLVEPNAPSQLADKIKFCLDDPEPASRICEAAFELVCNRFSSETMLKQYLSIYQRLVNE